MLTLENAGTEIKRRALEKRKALPNSKPLWPAPYSEGSAENAYKFLLELHTWNEAAGRIERMPDREYLEEYAREWWEAWETGRPLCMEKCRRMVISWAARGLELYVMGLARADGLIGGEDYEASAKHCWRYKHLYTDLRRRRPDWNLPPHTELRFKGEKQLSMFGLANGSAVTILNGRPDSVQGDGVRFVTFEEFGIYSAPASMLAQAKIITQAAAGERKGFVNLITNSAVDEEWQSIKRGGLDDSQKPELEEVIRGLEAADLPTGMRYLKLHHYADPEKDMNWLQEVEREMADTPRDYRLQILMEDSEDADAIWQRSDIDPHKVDLAHVPELLKIVIALDPNTKGDEPGADEVGIVVVAGGRIGTELHGYVLADYSGKHPPEKVARLVVWAEQKFGASEIAYESNQGGDWIPALLNTEYERQQISIRAPFVEVTVYRGKQLRAEPIAAKYRQGFVHHVNSPQSLSKLESQLCRWNPIAGKISPGRLDALVIGMTRILGGGVGQSARVEGFKPKGR